MKFLILVVAISLSVAASNSFANSRGGIFNAPPSGSSSQNTK